MDFKFIFTSNFNYHYFIGGYFLSKYLYNMKTMELCIKCENDFKIVEHKNYPIKSFLHRDRIVFSLYKKDMDRLLIYRENLIKRGILSETLGIN